MTNKEKLDVIKDHIEEVYSLFVLNCPDDFDEIEFMSIVDRQREILNLFTDLYKND